MRRRMVVGLFACCAIVLAGNPAHSTGAIAEGVAPGGVAQGYALSIRADRPDAETARNDALAGCRKGPERVASGALPDAGQAKARGKCEVVSTFSNQCASLALDPKDGTPGAGWATADTQQKADDEALARCQNTAGDDRREFCKVMNQLCDGTAK
jgi:hypothetical protein